MAGLPWFAGQQSGWSIPSFGYMLGFVLAAVVVGALARRGPDRTGGVPGGSRSATCPMALWPRPCQSGHQVVDTRGRAVSSYVTSARSATESGTYTGAAASSCRITDATWALGAPVTSPRTR